MPDLFENNAAGLTSPACGGFSVTPSADTDLPTVTRAIYVGTGGSLSVLLLGGQTVTFANLPDAALLPVRVRRVLPQSTATSIVGLY